MLPTLVLTVLHLFLTGGDASSLLLARSEVNGACTGSGGAPGVCISTSSCISAGGKYISGACPGTPEDIKCCNKTACGTGNKGNCRFTSSCSSGNTETNQCPGPANFKCCMPAGSGPQLPSTSSGCKQKAIDGAKAIVNAFPGKVKEIGCIRNCDDPSSSDHCTGMATDMMVTEAGGKTIAGEPIAEWVMNHASDLSLKYVMWGQRIWEVSQDSVKPWSQWRYQQCTVIPNCVKGDRGDNTANHW
ncbi:hypothetical protein A1O7_08444 [Cladophialophora yegresii CBS 114405]|uniref:ARB-07466-like C-terminal domain-containing protein n=1 Tax=Cladophialophora yegresii CBS 114405 TaxID=1182544 RepID=W9VTM6_9EURO|nr:uncharacterized protein A1O7_08444 [Cladophialophora yegresii CBS 114405]EXJ55516.1 hypothetical protein A1O7_08444 [Cladophialophora yegresii CBS 114405]